MRRKKILTQLYNNRNFNNYNAILLYGHFLYYCNLLELSHFFVLLFLFPFFTKKQYRKNFQLFREYNYIEINGRACLWIDVGHTQYKERRLFLAHAERLADQLLFERKSTSQLFSGVARAAPVLDGFASGKARRKEKDAIRRVRLSFYKDNFSRSIFWDGATVHLTRLSLCCMYHSFSEIKISKWARDFLMSHTSKYIISGNNWF